MEYSEHPVGMMALHIRLNPRQKQTSKLHTCFRLTRTLKLPFKFFENCGDLSCTVTMVTKRIVLLGILKKLAEDRQTALQCELLKQLCKRHVTAWNGLLNDGKQELFTVAVLWTFFRVYKHFWKFISGETNRQTDRQTDRTSLNPAVYMRTRSNIQVFQCAAGVDYALSTNVSFTR